MNFFCKSPYIDYVLNEISNQGIINLKQNS